MPIYRSALRSRSRPKTPKPPCTTSCGKKPCSGCPSSKSTEIINKETLSFRRNKSRSRSRGREPQSVESSWKKDSLSKSKKITRKKSFEQPEQCLSLCNNGNCEQPKKCFKIPTPVKPSKLDSDNSEKQNKINPKAVL